MKKKKIYHNYLYITVKNRVIPSNRTIHQNEYDEKSGTAEFDKVRLHFTEFILKFKDFGSLK